VGTKKRGGKKTLIEKPDEAGERADTTHGGEVRKDGMISVHQQGNQGDACHKTIKVIMGKIARAGAYKYHEKERIERNTKKKETHNRGEKWQSFSAKNHSGIIVQKMSKCEGTKGKF